MAALTRSNVRIVAAWVEGELYAKRRKGRIVEVYGGSWGGTTNTMPASAFGLRKIEESTPGYNVSTGAGISLVPNQTGSLLFAYTALNNVQTPADVSLSTTPNGLYFTVKGYE